MSEDESRRAPARRDPTARRRAIIAAAAELLVEGGGDLTHRRVAEHAGVPLGATTYYFTSLDQLRDEALALLSAEVETELVDLRHRIAATRGDPGAVAHLAHRYLLDRRQLRADAAIWIAAMRQPRLRPLAQRWFDGTVEALSAWTGLAEARALTVLLDGAILHALLRDEPLDLESLTRAVTALMPPRTDGRAHTTSADR